MQGDNDFKDVKVSLVCLFTYLSLSIGALRKESGNNSTSNVQLKQEIFRVQFFSTVRGRGTSMQLLTEVILKYSFWLE